MIRTQADDKGEMKRVKHETLAYWPRLSGLVFGAAVFSFALAGSAAHAAITATFADGVATFTITGNANENITLEVTLVTEDFFGADNPDADTDYLTYNGGLHLDPPTPLSEINSIIIKGDDSDNIIDGSLLTGENSPPMEVNVRDGDDVVIGGAGEDVINGGAGNDILNGGPGDDEISGGSGNDLTRGDEGDDTLGGGGGWDVIDYATDAGPGGVSVDLEANEATDGWGGDDELVADSFSAIRGKVANDILTGYAGRATTILGNAGNDVITGGEMADVLFGDSGDDEIDGGDGSDFIFGGTGNDTITGGAGNLSGNDIICGDGDASPYWPPYIDPVTLLSDTVELVNTSNRIPPRTIPDFGGSDDIIGGWGNDRIYGGGGGRDRINGDGEGGTIYADNDVIYGDYDYDLDGDGVNEQDTTQGGTDFIRGGPGSDEIYPGAGTDYASGGALDDRIFGSPGQDFIFGGEVRRDGDGFGTSTPEVDTYPADWVDYSMAPAGVEVELSSGVLSPGFAYNDGETVPSMDIIYGIENIQGSEFDDELTGTDIVGNDLSRLYNNGWDNWIFGGDGDDLIIGGLGDDRLDGEGGNDEIFGDGADQFEGGDDRLIGAAGNDVLHGEGGDDELRGGPGDDIISGGVGEDTLDYNTLVTAAVVVNLSGGGDGTATGASIGNDTIDNCDSTAGFVVDCSVGSGNEFYSRVEIVWGSNSADTITGYTDWPTRIEGRAGNDVLTGGDDDDVILGEGGNDTIEGGLGDDELIGGEDPGTLDTDTVTYANAAGAVTVNLGMSGPQNTSAAGFDTLAEFENLIGSANDDILTGSAEGNVITGGAGNDILNGRGDQDVIINGILFTQQDTLDGGAGSDSADYRLGDPAAVNVPNLNQAINDGEGGSDILLNMEAVLLPNNALYVSAGPDWTISPGGTVVLQGAATGGSGNYSYVWDTVPPTEPEPGQAVCDVEIPGLDDRCIAQPAASPEETTTYRLTVTDVNPATGSMTVVNSNYVKITVADTLIVDAGPDLTISTGRSIQLSASASGGVTPYIIAWSPTTGLTKTDILLPEASPNTTTTYTLTVTDQTGQAVSDTATITVTNPYTVNAGTDVTITLGQSTQLNAVVQGGTSPYTYQWMPALGLSSTTIANPVASPTTPQTAYTVTATDGTGRIATDSVIVTVTSITEQPDTGDQTDGGTDTFSPPQSSPVDQSSTGGTIWIFPQCGAGVSQAFVLMNMLLLMGLYRRRR